MTQRGQEPEQQSSHTRGPSTVKPGATGKARVWLMAAILKAWDGAKAGSVASSIMSRRLR